MKKNQGIVRCLEFLIARDGDADLLRHRLSSRETFLDDVTRSPVCSSAPIDRASYFRNMARRRSKPSLEQRMLWILATAAARLDKHGRSMTRRLYDRLSSTLASQFSKINAPFGSSELARRFSAFHLADAAAELPTLGFAAAQI